MTIVLLPLGSREMAYCSLLSIWQTVIIGLLVSLYTPHSNFLRPLSTPVILLTPKVPF